MKNIYDQMYAALVKTTSILGEIENTGPHGLPFRLKELKIEVDMAVCAHAAAQKTTPPVCESAPQGASNEAPPPLQIPCSVGHTSLRDGTFYPIRAEVSIHVGESHNRGNCFATVSLGGRGATDARQEAVEAAAAFIVRACNAHYDLLEVARAAERSMLNLIEQDEFPRDTCPADLYDISVGAIAKAEGIS